MGTAARLTSIREELIAIMQHPERTELVRLNLRIALSYMNTALIHQVDHESGNE